MTRLGKLLRRLQSRLATDQDNDASTNHPDDEWLDEADTLGGSTRSAPELSALHTQPDMHPDDWFFGASAAVAGQEDYEEAASDAEAASAEASDLDDLPLDPNWSPPWASVQSTHPLPEFPIETPTDAPDFQAASWITIPRLDPARRKALLKASAIVDRLAIYERRHRERARLVLAELLELFPSPASARAIGDLAADGATLKEIQEATEIKAVWSATPSLWLCRHHTKVRGWTVVNRHPSLRNAMTWRLALGLTRGFQGQSAEDILTGALLDEWARLRPQRALRDSGMRAAFYSFPVFLSLKAGLAEGSSTSELLTEGLNWLSDDDLDHATPRSRSVRAYEEHREVSDVSPTIWLSRALQPSKPSVDENGR